LLKVKLAQGQGGAVNESGVERGAAEDNAGVPVTPTDVDASRTPPSEPSDPATRAEKEKARAQNDEAR
jgi:hypothetical protein